MVISILNRNLRALYFEIQSMLLGLGKEVRSLNECRESSERRHWMCHKEEKMAQRVDA